MGMLCAQQHIDTVILRMDASASATLSAPNAPLVNLSARVESYSSIGHLIVHYSFPNARTAFTTDNNFFALLSQLPPAQTGTLYFYSDWQKEYKTLDTIYQNALEKNRFTVDIRQKATLAAYPYINKPLSDKAIGGIFFPKLDTLVIGGESAYRSPTYLYSSFGEGLDSLKALYLMDSHEKLLALPTNISKLQQLKTLHYETENYSSYKGVAVPSSFYRLQQLEVLVMNGGLLLLDAANAQLKNLKKLQVVTPTDDLTNVLFSSRQLQEVYLRFVDQQRNPLPDFQHMQQLQHLLLENIKQLPKGIEQLSELRVLQIQQYHQRPLRLPRCLKQLRALEKLILDDVRRLPPDVSTLENLRHLEIARYRGAKLPNRWKSKLAYVAIQAVRLKGIPKGMIHPSSLRQLYLKGIFKTLPDSLLALPQLEHLSLNMKNPIPIPYFPIELPKLKQLYLSTTSTEEIKGKTSWPSLKQLTIKSYATTLALPIQTAKKLQGVTLVMPNLKILPKEIGGLYQLEDFNLYSYYIGNLPEDWRFPHLVSTRIHLPRLTSFPNFLLQQPTLRSIALKCSIQDLAPLCQLYTTNNPVSRSKLYCHLITNFSDESIPACLTKQPPNKRFNSLWLCNNSITRKLPERRQRTLLGITNFSLSKEQCTIHYFLNH